MIKLLLLPVTLILLVFLSALPIFATNDNTVSPSETVYSQQDFKNDLSAAKEYMVAYKDWLMEVQSSDFGNLGFQVNQQGVDEMDNILTNAYTQKLARGSA